MESGWRSSGKWKRWTKRQNLKAGGGKRLVVDRLLERFHIYAGVILVDITFFSKRTVNSK